MGIRTALETSIANYFFGWVTPGGAFGAPAAIVVLARRGVSWDAAAIIAFGKSITGTAFLLLLAFTALAAGIGPSFGSEIQWILAVGSGVVTVMLAIPMIGAFFPRRSLAWIDRMEARFGAGSASRLILAGDAAEAAAVRQLLGDSWKTTPVSSAKGLRILQSRP